MAPPSRTMKRFSSSRIPKSGNVEANGRAVAKAHARADTEVRVRRSTRRQPRMFVWCDRPRRWAGPTNMGLLSWKMKRFCDETRNQSGWNWTQDRLRLKQPGGWGGGRNSPANRCLPYFSILDSSFSAFTDYARSQGPRSTMGCSTPRPRASPTSESCRILGRRLPNGPHSCAMAARDQHPAAEVHPSMTLRT